GCLEPRRKTLDLLGGGGYLVHRLGAHDVKSIVPLERTALTLGSISSNAPPQIAPSEASAIVLQVAGVLVGVGETNARAVRVGIRAARRFARGTRPVEVLRFAANLKNRGRDPSSASRGRDDEDST